MGSEAIKNWNAKDRRDYLRFDPKDLTIVEDDEASPLYDPDGAKAPVSESMVLSILRHGVRVPILVRRNGEGKDGKAIVEVVDGRTRVRALIEANRRLEAEGGEPLLCPGIQTKGEERELADLVVEANEQRRGVTVLERARKAVRLAEMYGRSRAEIAERFGVSTVAVGNWFELMSCSAAVQKAVEQGKVPASVAAKLAPLPAAEQKEALDKMVAEGATKGRNARAAVEKAKGRDGEAKKLPTRRQLQRLREVLADESGVAVAAALHTLDLVLDGVVRTAATETFKAAWKMARERKVAK